MKSIHSSLLSLSLFLFLLISLCITSTPAYEEEDGIIILTDDNFHEVIKSFKMIMVAYYAPWCHFCKEFFPEYIKAAAILKEKGDDSIRLAKIDATANLKITQEFQIKGYPTIKLFYANVIFDYSKLRTADILVDYMLVKLKGSIERLTTVKEVEEYKAKTTAFPILLSTISQGEAGYAEFQSVAIANERIAFVVCQSSECKERYKAPIVMLTHFDEQEYLMTEHITVQSIKRFIEVYSIELGGRFNDYAADVIFDFNKTCLFYFRSESDSNREVNDALMKTIAKDYKEQMYIFVQDIEGEELLVQSANYFFVTKDLLPQIQIVNIVNEDDVRMHIMKETPITEQSVRKFIKDYYDGKIVKELLSELIPDYERIGNESYEKLVGRNYVNRAVKSEKSYFVFIYIVGEPKGKEIHDIWGDLHTKYKDSDEIIFAGIDLTLNEVEGVDKSQVPIIRLYVKGDKEHPKVYTGESKLVLIEEWMAEKLGWTKDLTLDSEQKANETKTNTDYEKKTDL